MNRLDTLDILTLLLSKINNKLTDGTEIFLGDPQTAVEVPDAVLWVGVPAVVVVRTLKVLGRGVGQEGEDDCAVGLHLGTGFDLFLISYRSVFDQFLIRFFSD